jgi:hypothetical protein
MYILYFLIYVNEEKEMIYMLNIKNKNGKVPLSSGILRDAE